MNVFSISNRAKPWRVGEREAIESHFGPITCLKEPRDLYQFDGIGSRSHIFWRADTEKTTETYLREMQDVVSWASHRGAVSINHPRSWLACHAKEIALKEWADDGLPVPEFLLWSGPEGLIQSLQDRFGPDPRKHFLIRTNNLTDGRGSFFVRNDPDDLRKAARAVLSYARGPWSRNLAVEFINTDDGRGFCESFRVIVAGLKVVAAYGRVSKKPDWIAITGRFDPSFADRWLESQTAAGLLVGQHADLFVRAVDMLHLDHAGLDVICRGGDPTQPVLLEVQPHYSSGYVDVPPFVPPFFNPYQEKLVAFITANRKLIDATAPFYAQWLDKHAHFDRAYAAIKESIES